MPHVDEGTLHAYLDGELPSAERTALEAHLAACATCRANLTEERALRERATAVLGSAGPAERPAPPLEQLRREPQRSPWRMRRSFAWAASIAVALGVGYYLRNPAAEAIPATTPEFGLYDRPAAAPVATQEEKRVAPTRLGQRATRPPIPADELARAARPRRADSAPQAPASGLLASAPPAPMAARRASDSLGRKRAEPLRLEEVVVTGSAAANAAAGAPAPRDRPASTDWPIISRGVARSLLGADPVGLPGLATRRIRRSPGSDGMVVVEQAVDSSTVIQIFQRPASANALSDSSGRGYFYRSAQRERADRLARFVKGLRVEITGPLSADSLNRLLEQVAPLP